MSRIATRRPPIWLAAYLLVLLIWLLGLYLPLFFGGFPGLIDSLDFSYYYAAARIGLEHGWSHIYDLQLQQQVFAQLHPYDVFDWRRYFVSPPPVAWLVAPLTLLPLAPAFWIFAGISATAFAATGWLVTPGRGIARLALFLTVACTYPVLIAIQTGQVSQNRRAQNTVVRSPAGCPARRISQATIPSATTGAIRMSAVKSC